MFDQLRQRWNDRRDRRETYRATAHLDARSLRDIGLVPRERWRALPVLSRLCP